MITLDWLVTLLLLRRAESGALQAVLNTHLLIAIVIRSPHKRLLLLPASLARRIQLDARIFAVYLV